MSLRTLKFDEACAHLPTELALADRVERMTDNLNEALAEAFNNGLRLEVGVHLENVPNGQIPQVLSRILKPLTA